uniref:KH_dom_type_1 domain-containing protein n=1 Tax=Bursaphelenchus xylophilus TaxID=6326 RepID=A0A1I7SBC4_BURXY
MKALSNYMTTLETKKAEPILTNNPLTRIEILDNLTACRVVRLGTEGTRSKSHTRIRIEDTGIVRPRLGKRTSIRTGGIEQGSRFEIRMIEELTSLSTIRNISRSEKQLLTGSNDDP